MDFLDKYSDMYYYLNQGNIDAKVIILGIQEGVDISKTNFQEVLDIRERANNTKDYEDNFYYHDEFDEIGPYFDNAMSLIKGIRKVINENFGKEYFFTDIEPFPKPENQTKLNDFYETDEINDEKMRNHSYWEIRMNKLKDLLKGKIILVGSHYHDNFILNDLGIDKSIYQRGKIFIYNETLYIKVEHFSYLVKKDNDGNIIFDEKLKNEIKEINKILSEESNGFKKFINNLI